MSKPNDTRIDPRIAPVEMIVTRNKSAQQRMQLREKDRSMTKITDLLKSPTNKTPKVKKKVKKPSPTVKKVLVPKSETFESENPDNLRTNEYYPDKLRRKFEQKRVFLRPKYESTTVVKLNKRKLCTPQRGFLQDDTLLNTKDFEPKTKAMSPVFAELSMEEVVRIVEETESLDDEDLMEILTCPSPVWWEEPPNEKYVEEPIFRRTSTVSQKHKKRPSKAKHKLKTDKVTAIPTVKEERVPNVTENIEINRKDDKFLTKRRKLETVLGSIKSNVSKLVLKEDRTDSSNEINVIDNTKLEKLSTRHNKSRGQRKRIKLSESNESLSDLSFIEDDVLKDFENIDVPIKHIPVESVDIISIKSEHSEEVIPKLESGIKTEESIPTEQTQVPKTLPPLTRRPEIELAESPSVKSVSDETDVSTMSGIDGDTISDTNIKFISDDDDVKQKSIKVEDTKPKIQDISDSNIKFTNDVNDKVIKQEHSKNGCDDTNLDILKAIKDKKEFITVYKIVSNDAKDKSFVNKLKNIPEYSNYIDKLKKHDSDECSKYDGQLNSFFKKCKNVNRKKRSDATDSQLCDTCEPKKSTISIAQEENVKYCLNCSSIFDTDDCSYCLNTKANDVNDSDNSEKK